MPSLSQQKWARPLKEWIVIKQYKRVYMEDVEDPVCLDPAKRADIMEHIFFPADYQVILETKY